MSLCALSSGRSGGRHSRGPHHLGRAGCAIASKRIEEVDAEVQAWAFLDRDHAMRQAEAADQHRKQGKALGPLHGVPIGIKDIFDTGDMPTEFGSPLWAGRTPRRDAAVVARLRAAGAVIMGKTVTTEYAYFHPGKTTQSTRSRAHAGRLLQRLGRRGGGAHGAGRHRLADQRLGDPARPPSAGWSASSRPTASFRAAARCCCRARSITSACSRARSRTRRCWPRRSPASTRRTPTRDPSPARRSPRWPRREPPLPPRLAFVRTPAWKHAEPVTPRGLCRARRGAGRGGQRGRARRELRARHRACIARSWRWRWRTISTATTRRAATS